ncbi:MAG TPA: nucleotidyltransferase domain-containing protein [Phycisphaerae bacterium]|nr:nucleotidyltransferase domain-containing protein [Phycisphaerae bacterium]
MLTAHIDIPMDKIRDFCRRWKIRELALFGSVLREDFRADSDVDVLVTFEPDAEWDYWVGWPEMIDELEATLGRRVDLVEKEALENPYRRHEILRTHQVIYSA